MCSCRACPSVLRPAFLSPVDKGNPATARLRGHRAEGPIAWAVDTYFFVAADHSALGADEAQDGPFATVAREEYLQKYAGARNEHRFEVVGYGLEKVLPFADFGGDTRRKAEPRLLNLVSNPQDTYIQLSNNPRTGGTCFGDSGGPTFDTTNSLLLVAVTSFGYSPNCTGVGGAYRLDQPDDLEFLAGFGIAP